jgi:hypothetical protein
LRLRKETVHSRDRSVAVQQQSGFAEFSSVAATEQTSLAAIKNLYHRLSNVMDVRAAAERPDDVMMATLLRNGHDTILQARLPLPVPSNAV